MCVSVRKFCKTEFKREKGAVIYVREIENNAGGWRQETAKVNLLCTLQLNKTPACLSVCLFKGSFTQLQKQWYSISFRGGTSSSCSSNRNNNLVVEI